MTWQLGAFLLLALGLAGGFAWYERGRPDAKVVALVAALAAFAALGRVAFAAVPNVKPTTDIVLIAGFALGAAPGYVVGALAALTSNFFFGQGPWTPWQMAGWGLIGVLGALLARTTGRRISRLPLAVICFTAGFAFTALQDVGDWMNYSDHSVAQLGVYVGKGVGFDLIHAVGCFAFALAFGPAMIRSLTRFDRRLHVKWTEPRTGAALLVVAVAACGLAAPGTARAAAPGTARAAAPGAVPHAAAPHAAAATPHAAAPHAAAATPHAAARRVAPLRYLFSAENLNGGVGMAPGQPSSPMVSAWQAMALAAGGIDPTAHAKAGGRGVIAYLARTVDGERGPGAVERTILAASWARQDVTDFGGRNLLAALRRDIARNGAVAGQTNLTAFAVLALRAAGRKPPARMLVWLARQQDTDGGFNFDTAPGVSDPDDTGAALEALAGSGRQGTIARAVAFLRHRQNADGGFGDAQQAPSNAQSTAFAVQGLEAVGLNPASLHRGGAPSPLSYLRSLILPSGAIDYARGDSQTPVWVTSEALLALDGRALAAPDAPAR